MCEGQNEAEAKQNIELLLEAVESLSQDSLTVWDRNCAQRELNVGYECGDEPWTYNQGLSHSIIRRMSDAGVSFRITLYPDRKTTEVSNQGT